MIIFIGMETGGALRRRFQDLGYETYSCDLLPSEDGGEEMRYSPEGLPLGRHLVGDVFEVLDHLWANDLWPQAAVFHPDCTHLTGAAAWAFKDPDFVRFPGVGYHQRVKPGTLTGKARRDARDAALDQARRLIHKKIGLKVFENPVGGFSHIAKANQLVHPYMFGDDASKGTCLWAWDDGPFQLKGPLLTIDPAERFPGRRVEWPRGSGQMVERWSNQTDSNQNAHGPSDDRWKNRSRTFPGIANALVAFVHGWLKARYY